MSRHVLDRPIWTALTTRQSQVSVGGGRARRFAPGIGPLASACDDSAQSLAALEELIPADGSLILLQADPIVLPPSAEAAMTASGVQMVLESLPPAPDRLDSRIERLGDEDVPAMVALAGLTKPGPFEPGTPRLGDFWGIRENGVLLAMAGERMKQPGYAEVSGVCTHPDARGRGFARALSAAVAERILDRGETPYLHAYASNTAAIRLYESLGFRLRRPMHVAVLARPRGTVCA
ncbi:MAG: GNAT family N-acetyltransferase [Elusimicrobia bacterium]|nr:GNAT family N-acetyltransferase [Elusimicrobiota bacterium]